MWLSCLQSGSFIDYIAFDVYGMSIEAKFDVDERVRHVIEILEDWVKKEYRKKGGGSRYKVLAPHSMHSV